MKNLNSGGTKSGKRKPYIGRPVTVRESWNTVWRLLAEMMDRDIKKTAKK